MNTIRVKYLLGTVLLFAYFTSHAETLVVPYSSFYSHTKKIDAKETNALQFSFGFKQVQSTELCTINSAYIHTQKQDLPLTLINQQRFTVPTDKILRMARAEIVLELQQAANRCDMSVQLETKAEYLKRTYSKQELQMLLEQYQAFFSGMGSFLSFMMPDVQGLNLHFPEETQLLSLPEDLKLENETLALNADWITNNKGLQLDITPLRVTAMVIE
ncbi:MAG: hypothetical protein ACI88A_003000 [Paraglaciecola sp.]|jgi:hypothetical protein